MIEHLRYDPKEQARSTIIWMHGFGADANDFPPIIPVIDVPGVRYLFPQANLMPTTINGGAVMRAWHDIITLDFSDDVNLEPIRHGLSWSADQVFHLIEQQIEEGIPADKIFLAGFSQGGAVALWSGLMAAYPLAGIIGLSTYFPEPLRNAWQHKQVPLLMMHGKQDPTVPFSEGVEARDRLRQDGFNIDWHEYDMEHEVNDEELIVIREWLLHQLG